MASISDSHQVKRVAVIGAGASGIAVSKYLRAEKAFPTIDIFEQRGYIGGLWKYTSQSSGDGFFKVPQTDAHVGVENPVGNSSVMKDSQVGVRDIFLSPIYDMLETNIPHELMRHSDHSFPDSVPVFPKHEAVQEYLEEYGRDMPPVQLHKQVTDVRLLRKDPDVWEVGGINVLSRESFRGQYDAVVVASGHFAVPSIPAIEGISQWTEKFPGSVIHAKYYRHPAPFAGKKVVVVGSGPSGIDIAIQTSAVASLPVISSRRNESPILSSIPAIREMPEISRFVPEGRKVMFVDGREESRVDSIVFCTGYLYSMPFLRNLDLNPIKDGTRVEHTYKHLFYAPHPTLTFVGLPQRVIPFPLVETQAASLARVYSGRLNLPSYDEMLEWEQSVIDEQGSGKKFHLLHFPKDFEYMDSMHDWAASAEKRTDLESNVLGKMPKRRGPRDYWMRENILAIKMASVRKGGDRKYIRTLEELGFSFDNRADVTAPDKVQ